MKQGVIKIEKTENNWAAYVEIAEYYIQDFMRISGITDKEQAVIAMKQIAEEELTKQLAKMQAIEVNPPNEQKPPRAENYFAQSDLQYVLRDSLQNECINPKPNTL